MGPPHTDKVAREGLRAGLFAAPEELIEALAPTHSRRNRGAAKDL
ncbi:MAG: hypothetical protein IPJ94_24790 [Chloroflexi bacterium]|nr:hypothetical protein [Chloroflexota bacterium]